MPTTPVLCTRNDLLKACALIMSTMRSQGVVARNQLASLRTFGLTYATLELAIRDLKAQGLIEELYVLPEETSRPGRRKDYYALTVDLDAGQVTLPEGTIRERDALQLLVAEEVA